MHNTNNPRVLNQLLRSIGLLTVCWSLPVYAETTVTPLDADTALGNFVKDYLSESFEAVANGVAYEPYAGMQRGAQGTALAGSGNAIDQALLLAHAIDQQVAAWRLAQGRLDSDALSHLLAAPSYTHDGLPAFSADAYELYDPINDTRIQRVARDHVWLEVQQSEGDEWLALDPSFPDARMGQAFAKARRYFNTPPNSLKQLLRIVVMQETADGKKKRLGMIDGDVAELARHPIALVTRGIPQYEDLGDTESAGSDDGLLAGGGGGGLLGGGGGGGLFGGGGQKTAKPSKKVTSADAERSIVGVEYRRELSYAGKKPEALTATMVADADPASRIAREWLEFTLSVPGQGKRTFSRDLYRADGNSDSPATMRRYSIAVVAGELSRAVFEAYRNELDGDQVDRTRTSLAQLKDQPASNETALKVLRLESENSLAPHLINLAFAFESDALTARMAAGASVRVVRDTPRVLITTVETGLNEDGEVESMTSLDLRLDEVVALPYGGMPVGTAALFQRARGMQESALEGRLLARFVEDADAVVTTARIMREALAQGQELVLAIPTDRSALTRLTELPAEAAMRIGAALDAGRQVILPTAAARIGGARHWGWWDVNPSSGAFVGVMQSGQHQAMVQYTVTLEEIGLNDAMAYVLGAMVGSTATMTLYAAKMIEYGRVTPQLIAEVAAGIEHLTCVTCPSIAVNVSPIAVSASAASDCFHETGVSIGTGGGFSANIDFCENYKLGISCAASLMLGTFQIEGGVSIDSNIGIDLGPLSCD